MISTSAVVADSNRHAQAMIAWLKLDPAIWKPIVYGQKLNGARFAAAQIVRPMSGVFLAHIVWLEAELLPSVDGRKWSIPQCWCPDGGDDLIPQVQGFASMWDHR